MSVQLTETDQIEGDKIKRYTDTGQGDHFLILNLKPDSYVAEFRVPADIYGMEEFADSISEFGLENSSGTATFEPEKTSSYRQRGEVSELLQRPSFPEECTYLKAETSDFNAALEDWNSYSSIIISVPDMDVAPVEDYLGNIKRNGFDSELVTETLDGIKEVLSN
jgi:hypothetical protein